MSAPYPGACRDVAQALARCLSETSCIKSGKSVKECLKHPDMAECSVYRTGYYDCRRGWLDNRNRIRGPKYKRTTGGT
jgi:cytochrome c oxidase assembly factor 5